MRGLQLIEGMGATLRRYFVAGLLVWIPLVITLWVLKLLVDLMDQSLLLLPAAWHTDALLGFHVPGLGLILTTAIVLAISGRVSGPSCTVAPARLSTARPWCQSRSATRSSAAMLWSSRASSASIGAKARASSSWSVRRPKLWSGRCSAQSHAAMAEHAAPVRPEASISA